MRGVIRGWVDENPWVTIKSLCDKCKEDLNLEVSESVMFRCLKKFLYSLKRLTAVCERRNTPEAVEFRRTTPIKFSISSQTLITAKIFLVEVGFNVSIRKGYGYSLIDTPASLCVPSIRSRNIFVCAIMTRSGMYSYSINTTAFNHKPFADILNDICVIVWKWS
jgi:hypothetical protein